MHQSRWGFHHSLILWGDPNERGCTPPSQSTQGQWNWSELIWRIKKPKKSEINYRQNSSFFFRISETMLLDWGLQHGLANLQGGRTKKSPSPSPPDPFIQPVGIFGAKQEVSFFWISLVIQSNFQPHKWESILYPTPPPTPQPNLWLSENFSRRRPYGGFLFEDIWRYMEIFLFE